MRKRIEHYFLTVEGENEKWYFEHLQNLINHCDTARRHASFHIVVARFPYNKVKSIPAPAKRKAFHIVDYESNCDEHIQEFKKVLDQLEEIKTWDKFDYRIGYSNYAFELWMLLHKTDQDLRVDHRKQYFWDINKLYGTKYNSLKRYKSEAEFKKVLRQIALEDVYRAIKNAEKLRQRHMDRKHTMLEYNGFAYFADNPDVTVHECVKRILKDCQVKG